MSLNADASVNLGASQSAPTTGSNHSSANTTSTTAASSTFNTKATEFVPKGKIVKTTEAFPTLGEVETKPAKKKVAPVVQ